MEQEAPTDDTLADAKYINYILWFGCPPERRVDAKSTIARDLFIQLKEKARPYDGRVVLPETLMFWHPGNDGEMQHKITT